MSSKFNPRVCLLNFFRESIKMNQIYLNTPLPLCISFDEQFIYRIDFTTAAMQVSKNKKNLPPLAKKIEEEFWQYFAGKRKIFTLSYKFLKATDFQKIIWHQLSKIPYGQTFSYSLLAEKSGQKKSFRAVGGACHRNPLPILIPCHRVIGKNQSLGGFAAGLSHKTWLLSHEGSISFHTPRNNIHELK